MAERLAYHIAKSEDVGSEQEVKDKFGRFTVLITIPAFTPAIFAKLREWLPNTYILAAEVNAMRVQIPADGSVPPYAYGQEIKRTFPEASLWKNCCTGKYVTDGNPQSVNYSLSDAVIAWWRERVRRFVNIAWIYQDDSAQEVPDWLRQNWESLGLIDDDGDGFPERARDLAITYEHFAPQLTAAIRSVIPIVIANTGTPRVDSNLNGISLEMSGIGPEAAGEAFKAQLLASRNARRYPRLCIAWCKNQQELDEWRAVQASDPGLREVLVGIESQFTDWR